MTARSPVLHTLIDDQLEAGSYDAWFRDRVQEALDEPYPSVQHEQVMQDAQRLIDQKRCA